MENGSSYRESPEEQTKIKDTLERHRQAPSYNNNHFQSSIISNYQKAENQRKYSSTPNLPDMHSSQVLEDKSLPSGKVLELRQRFMSPMDSTQKKTKVTVKRDQSFSQIPEDLKQFFVQPKKPSDLGYRKSQNSEEKNMMEKG